MARCEKLEAILQAQFELEYAEPEAFEDRVRRLHLLVDQVIACIAGSPLSRAARSPSMANRVKPVPRSS